MLGGFHMTKALLHCIGKFMKINGLFDALIETGRFDIKTAEEVAGGTHYVRSFCGMLILSQGLLKLKWDAFWEKIDVNIFKNFVTNFKDFQNDIKEMKKNDNLKMNFDKSCQSMGDLKIDFLNFTNHCVEKSQMCTYVNNFLNMIELLKYLVAADRGDWETHLLLVQNILPIFREFDSINHLQYGSLYLENMCHLLEEHPEIYTKFMQGHFVVKQRYGSFNAVAGDMKLERTNHRSQKSTGGIIGQIRQSEYVTKWEIVYHEILSVTNAFREIANNLGSRETKIHHELGKHCCSMFNSQVKTVAEFILEKGNPYKMLAPNLYNFASGTTIPLTATNKILHCYLHGKEQTESFLDQSKKLSGTIHKIAFPKPVDTSKNLQPQIYFPVN